MPAKYMFNRPVTDPWTSRVDVSTPWGEETWYIGGFMSRSEVWIPLYEGSYDEAGIRSALEEQFPDIRGRLRETRNQPVVFREYRVMVDA